MIFLASRSPRRRALLEQIGVHFATLLVDVDETRRAGEPPAELVRRLAGAKAGAGWDQLPAHRRAPVLGADTVVVAEERVLGKPADADEASMQLQLLGGRDHEVMTAVALASASGVQIRSSHSRVRLRQLSEEERSAYVASGEPLDKAGGYGIQGLAGAFVSHLEGSYSGVMGLPLYETAELLADAGIDFLGRPQSRSRSA